MQILMIHDDSTLLEDHQQKTDWEIFARGPVRSKLKCPVLDYLHRQLQIGPRDMYRRLLKRHTRLSTYDSCNKIMSMLDMLQGKFCQ